MLKLSPAIEVWPSLEAPAWVPPVTAKTWIVLNADTSLDDVARIVARVAEYVSDCLPASPDEAAQVIALAEVVVVSGGLIVTGNGFRSEPSCCCGLEQWREWYGVKPGGSSPWLGHDPTPGVECGETEAVICSDSTDEAARLTVSYLDLAVALAEADADLTAFLSRLDVWRRAAAISQALDVVGRFADAFAITCPPQS